MTTRSELSAAGAFLAERMPAGGRVLCAVSGGLDSMCLLHYLDTWGRRHGFSVGAAHFNHRLRPAADRDEDFVRDSRCVILGTPTYFASTAAEVKTWLDTSAKKLGLAGKLGGAFATSNVPQGGPVMAIESILTQLLVKGMLVYSGGTSLGKPNIHLGPVCTGPDLTCLRRAISPRIWRPCAILPLCVRYRTPSGSSH